LSSLSIDRLITDQGVILSSLSIDRPLPDQFDFRGLLPKLLSLSVRFSILTNKTNQTNTTKKPLLFVI